MTFRLFPFLIFACFLLLVVKVADIVQGESFFSENLLIASGYASSEKKEEKEEKTEEKKEEGKEGEKKEEHGDKKDAKDKEKDKKKEKEAIKVSDTPPQNVIKVPQGPEFTPAEVEVLQRLRQRREQLDAKEKEMDVREKVLRVTEGKIDQKLAELNKLKSDVEQILSVYNEKEEVKLQSLVKIYENMKPKDAARIFEELDMQTLLPVIDKMKEAKVAPILAQMDPKKAKTVTTELSQMRRLPPANANLQN